MATTTVTGTEPPFTQLELRSAYGPVYRQVSTALPRDARDSEIPVIDISDIYGDFDARSRLAKTIKAAAVGTGFFYIKNHGISQNIIENAQKHALNFFAQPAEVKQKASRRQSKYFNGYSSVRSAHVSPTESLDNREAFQWKYSPQYDPEPKDLLAIPAEVKPFLRGEEFVWENTSEIAGFKAACIAYWQACLTLARNLVKIFALCLDLPENYFEKLTTYPGSDGVFNYYPAMTPEEAKKPMDVDVGIGSHTDLQCFTLLWQDMVGGLQVLTKDGQWIKAPPKEGTFVVNIGDYLQRLSNDKFSSTVHRVYNRSTVPRLSMPFFFGFNFNETCGVLPTCVDENNPPKYEPISCGDWCQLRFHKGNIDQPATY